MNKSYIRAFLAAAMAVLLPFLCLGIYLQPVSGDLTRLGYLAERDFGWNAPQPVIIPDVRDVAPSVIVVGDSFSAAAAWQSIAVMNNGRAFRTFQWSDLSESSECLGEWLSSVRDAYPAARFVLIETVEREFLLRFGERKVHCNQPQSAGTLKWHYPSLPALRDVGITRSMPDPVYAMVSLMNTPTELTRPKRTGLAVVVPLARRDLFSSRRSDLLVFYEGDISLKSTWTPNSIRDAVANVKALQEKAERAGITVVVLVVPDKLTVYFKYFKLASPPVSAPDVWLELKRQGVTQVDLKATFFASIPGTIDLYLPNDTHVGNRGYLLMGKAVASLLDRTSAALPVTIGGTDARSSAVH